jgi:hypothetical protein
MAINNFETAATFRGKNKFSRLLDWKKTTPFLRALFGIRRQNRGTPVGAARSLARAFTFASPHRNA